jgi:tRNA uridine 5-carboxymethylaminomethyl modification enzyme
MARLRSVRVKPTKEVQSFLQGKNSAELKDGVLASDFLKRPEISYQELMQFIAFNENLTEKEIEQVEIQIKYEGYIKKAMEKVEKLKRMEAKRIPERIDYESINGLATEAKQKLQKIQPQTIAQASRISGVNPADISILMVYVEQGKIAKVSSEEV